MNGLIKKLMFMLDEDGGAPGGGGAPPAAPEPPATPPVEPTAPVTPPEEPAYTPKAYQAQARGEFKTDPFFNDYEDFTSVLSGLKEAKTKLSELESQAPVVPEAPDGYKMLDNKELDGVSFSADDINELRGIAAATHATQEQFELLVKQSVKQSIEKAKATKEFNENRQTAAAEALHTAWPSEKEFTEGWDRFNKAVTGIENSMKMEGVRELFKDPAYGDNPILIRIVSAFGRFFQDDKLMDGSSEGLSNETTGVLEYKSMK